MNEQTVTSLETMRLASQGSLVNIPGFGDGDTITVRLRKPNMLTLIKSGRIPNDLLQSATTLFEGQKKDKNGYTPEELTKVCDLMVLFCEACLVSPTYKEMTESGIELTQQQMTFIFNYSQGGVKSLNSFRDESRDSASPDDGGAVADTTESVA